MDIPLINGQAPDWASVEINIGTTIYPGVKELTWSDSREPGIVRGSGSAKKIARTRGEYDAEGAMVMWTQQGRELIAALSVIGTPQGLGWMEVDFDVTVSVSMPGGTISTTKLIGCNLVSREGGGSQGTDPLEISFDLDIMDIDDGGSRPVGVAI